MNVNVTVNVNGPRWWRELYPPATVVEGTDEVVVFGGEDKRGRLLDDVHVINLKSMEWVTPGRGAVKGCAPTPRKGHVAACLPGGKDVYVFGGVASSSSGEVSGELFALDAEAMTWRAVQPTGDGFKPAPRAGAAGAVVGDAWYITGGGGAEGGRKDTVALKKSPGAAGAGAGAGAAVEWVLVAEVEAGSSLAAEGATVVAVGGGSGAGASLLSFGGYDGVRYSNDVHVMKHPTAVKTAAANGGTATAATTAAAAAAAKPLVTPVKTKAVTGGDNNNDDAAAAAAAAADAASMAAAAAGGAVTVTPAAATAATATEKMTPRKPAADVASSMLVESQQLWVDPHGDPFNVVTAGHESAAHELRLMRRQLASAKSALAESEKECAAVRAQLSDEQAKTLRLEAQLGELQTRQGRQIRFVHSFARSLDSSLRLNCDIDVVNTVGHWS